MASKSLMGTTKFYSQPAAIQSHAGSQFSLRGLFVGLLVFLALAVSHRTLLFVEPWHEHSDYAVDAIQIERARHFQEIHGNYSRFDFRHPGPAFYYVYAIGEQLFYHWLHLVPSRYNAHVLSGLILQCLFFGFSLTIVDRWVRRPLFIPLALLLFTIHLSLAGNAFISTWPPRVLLMPFLCFVVGASSVAAGSLIDLPITVLAGCFLVHGHVAQPLYVLPIFVMAFWSSWRHGKLTRKCGRSSLCPIIVSVACVGVFLVPFVIDLYGSGPSNLAKILEFQMGYHGPGKTLFKALVYFAGYFGYVKKPEVFLSVFGPERASAISEHVTGYFVWAAIIAGVLYNARRVWKLRSAGERSFVLWLTAFTALSFLLSLYWGMAQVGQMWEYNGYVYYAILGCILYLFCVAICRFNIPKVRIVGAVLSILTCALVWQRQYEPLAIDYSTNKIPPAVEAALLADPLPNAPKYLLFNRGDWGEAVSIGLALNRTNHEFRANTYWGPKFAPNGGFEPVPPDFDMKGVSTWRLSRIGPADAGTLIRDNLRVYFKPLPLDPTNADIDCGDNGKLECYTLFGFASPLGAGTWTIDRYAGLVFDAPRVSSGSDITIFAEPFSGGNPAPSQPIHISVNGHEVFSGKLTAAGAIRTRVSADIWTAKKPTLMVLYFPAAVSEHQLKMSLDDRLFGWRIQRITFKAADELR